MEAEIVNDIQIPNYVTSSFDTPFQKKRKKEKLPYIYIINY